MAIISSLLSSASKVRSISVLRILSVWIVAASVLGGGDARYAWGGVEDSVTTIGAFQRAVALSVDPDGNAYVIDAGRNVLERFSSTGVRMGFVGGYGWGELSFDQPVDLSLSSGLDLYVADYGNHRIQRFDRNLNYVATLSGHAEGATVSFGYPSGIALSRSGTLFIADGENARVAAVNPLRGTPWYFGGNEARSGKLAQPGRVRIGPDDVIHVRDGNDIKEYDAFGTFVRTVHPAGHMRSFSLRDTMLVAWDDRALYVVGDHGSLLDTLTTATFSPGAGVIVDVAFVGEDVFLLCEHRLLVIPAYALKARGE